MSDGEFLEDELFDELMNEDDVAVVEADALFDKKVLKDKKPSPKHHKFSAVTGVTSYTEQDHWIRVYKPTEWDISVRPYIPKREAFENYVPQPRELELLLVAWEMEDKTNIVGPTGSGKSSMVEYACALTGRPYIRIQGRGDMESSALLGQLQAQSGSTVWSDGELTLGVRQGAVVCVDEWTLIPPEIVMSLQWLMEDNGKLLLTDMPAEAGDRLVIPHKGFRMVCTDNTRGLGDETGAFSATNVQNSATLDRFSTIIHVGYLDKTHELAVMKGAYPTLTDGMGSNMIQFAGLCRTAYEADEISLTLSPRTLLNWARKTLYYKDPCVAIRSAFFEKLSSDSERAAVAGFYKTAFGTDLAS